MLRKREKISAEYSRSTALKYLIYNRINIFFRLIIREESVYDIISRYVKRRRFKSLIHAITSHCQSSLYVDATVNTFVMYVLSLIYDAVKYNWIYEALDFDLMSSSPFH